MEQETRSEKRRMPERDAEYGKLLDFVAEFGAVLMSGGAEIYRVEESMRRLLHAYRLKTAEVFAIPSCVIVSATAPDGCAITRMRRVGAHGTDIELLERCNQLCRQLCKQPVPLKEARILLSALPDALPCYPLRRILLGYGIAPAFFAPLFGGGLSDALGAAVGGLAVGVCALYGGRFTGSNSFFRTAVCSAVGSLVSVLLARMGVGQSVDVVTISVLMMLAPGLALTNAMREMMGGDTISALTRIADAILTAGAIAIGTAVGLFAGQAIS